MKTLAPERETPRSQQHRFGKREAQAHGLHHGDARQQEAAQE
ncbi:hypothetical protein [Paraburkholderia sacchari]|nr:hypothetical protein [Paraburkholderia sacchari]